MKMIGKYLTNLTNIDKYFVIFNNNNKNNFFQDKKLQNIIACIKYRLASYLPPHQL
jgi:hypothetical protein